MRRCGKAWARLGGVRIRQGPAYALRALQTRLKGRNISIPDNHRLYITSKQCRRRVLIGKDGSNINRRTDRLIFIARDQNILTPTNKSPKIVFLHSKIE